MKHAIKSMMKRALPRPVIDNVRNWRTSLRKQNMLRTQRIFEKAADTPAYLEMNMLEALQRAYPFSREYGYDAKSLEDRGKRRAGEILRLPPAKEAASFLELGCLDGMVSCILCRKGKNTTAIDKRSEGFDERALREGVRLLRMDAAEMQFEDESFDFVFSYDAFEHFAQPERVLQEAIRVVRRGGHIYLVFGPLYMSPKGEHAYRSITVPYCQFLFPKSLINHFAEQQGLKPIDFSHVNGWSVQDYRRLWNKYSPRVKTLKYREWRDLAHLDLIRKYPSCFKSKSDYFENFIVAGIEILLQKTDQEAG
jgi:SAM-dependent methyltransferase